MKGPMRGQQTRIRATHNLKSALNGSSGLRWEDGSRRPGGSRHSRGPIITGRRGTQTAGSPPPQGTDSSTPVLGGNSDL